MGQVISGTAGKRHGPVNVPEMWPSVPIPALAIAAGKLVSEEAAPGREGWKASRQLQSGRLPLK